MNHPFTTAVFEYLHRVYPVAAWVYEPQYVDQRNPDIPELQQQSLFWMGVLVQLGVYEHIPSLLDWHRYDDWMTDFSSQVVPLLKRYLGATTCPPIASN